MRIHGIVNFSSSVASLPAGRASVVSGTDGSSTQGTPGQPSGRVTTSAFITPQSLVAFPFASGLVTGIWHVAKLLFPKGADSPWVGLAAAVFIGLLVYLISVSDRRVHLDRREKLVGFGIAAINCIYLFMAAVGVKTLP